MFAENGRPFTEGEIGRDDDRGTLVEAADHMEQQLAERQARWRPRCNRLASSSPLALSDQAWRRSCGSNVYVNNLPNPRRAT